MSAYLLDTMFLHMPTMEYNKGDAEDSDYEENVTVSQKKIDCVAHTRRLLDYDGVKIPLTI